jgi:alpha-1,3-glucosyltransferase
LNFKHIYLYASLAFFAYILKQYVLEENNTTERVTRLVKVAAVTLAPFFISFLPFIVAGGIDQVSIILARLFPFQRGLIHEYWAPNCWALYYFADKLINIVAARLGGSSVSVQVAGDLHQLKYLPQVSALVTTAIILLFSIPILIKFASRGMRFFKLVFLCGALFFLFGFHVH